jgi:hypothetical protein
MADVKEIDVPDVKPVVVVTRVTKRPSTTTAIKMVNSRASHFYFKRAFNLLRSLGKYR